MASNEDEMQGAYTPPIWIESGEQVRIEREPDFPTVTGVGLGSKGFTGKGL